MKTRHSYQRRLLGKPQASGFVRGTSGVGDGVISSSKSLSCQQLHALPVEGVFPLDFQPLELGQETITPINCTTLRQGTTVAPMLSRKNPTLLL